MRILRVGVPAGDRSLSMVDFVEWLGSNLGVVAVFCIQALVFGRFNIFVYIVYIFILLFRCC